jgi:hypothetical protein
MNLQTVRDCFKVWIKRTSSTLSDEQIDQLDLENIVNLVHSVYISHILDFGTKDSNFEKAYLHLCNLIQQLEKRTDDVGPEISLLKDQLDQLNQKMNTVLNKLHMLEQHRRGDVNPFTGINGRGNGSSPFGYTNWHNSYSPTTEFKFNPYNFYKH